jgi:hypothetical protein
MALEFRNAIFRKRSEMNFGAGMNLKLECFCGEHTFTEKVISDGGSRLRVRDVEISAVTENFETSVNALV